MDCPYEQWSYPYFNTDPFGFYPQPNLQDARQTTLHDYFEDVYGNPSNNSMNTGAMDPSGIDDTSILSMASMNDNMTLQLDTGHIGRTYLNYYFTDNYTYISSTDDGNPGTCTVQPGGGSDGGNTDVSPCPIPGGETTQFVQQAIADPIGAPTASDFLQTLVTLGNDDGSFITESNNAYGTDSCYFQNPTFGMLTSVTGTQWPVAQIAPGAAEAQVVIPGHNQWGPDVVGYSPGAVRFYQLNRPKLGFLFRVVPHFSRISQFNARKPARESLTKGTIH